MTTTVGAAVRVWCPDWCTVSEQTHLDDLGNWEGEVIHHGLEVAGHNLTLIALPDGTPQPEEPHHAPVMLMEGDRLVHPDEAERRARALLAMVARARGEQQERQH